MKEHPIWKGVFATEDGEVIGRRGKPLTQSLHHTGYRVCTICSEGKQRQFRVHRFVYECFFGAIDEGLVINHLDGVKTNNNLLNLELVTQSENSIHAFRTGLRVSAKGEDLVYAKLSNQKARELIQLTLEGYSNSELGEMFGLHPGYVSLVRHKHRWKHIWKEFQNQRCEESSTTIPLGSTLQAIGSGSGRDLSNEVVI